MYFAACAVASHGLVHAAYPNETKLSNPEITAISCYAQRPNHISVAHSRLEDLRRELAQQPGAIRRRKIQEDLIDTLALCVTDST